MLIWGGRVNDRSRIASIVKWVKRIEATPLSISEFFETEAVPFSRVQYYTYRRQLRESGPAGLRDRRIKGGNRRISFEHEAFLRGCIKQNPRAELKSLRRALMEEFGCEASVSTLSRVLVRIDPKRRRSVGRPLKIVAPPRRSSNSLGGFELIVALAWHLGWPQRTARLISKAVDAIKKTKDFTQRREESVAGRKKGGRFGKRYNQRRDVRTDRFASVSDKRQKKNWRSMNVVNDSSANFVRKSLAILALPVVTNNGQIRSVNSAQGQTLGHFCGFNYKQSTITKHLTDLKYIGASGLLLRDLPDFWKLCWGDAVGDSMMGPLLCYYIDGNTKALWSSKRVKKNKVTMLGRVMGCIEQVFIHDNLGHPIYFETYSGQGPTGERILGLFEKIEEAIGDVPRSKARVFRAIVMDGANNSVKTLRAFAAQDTFHFITTLDDNQWKERRIRSRSYPVRYRYGSATLRDLEIELEDSNERGHLISTRAVSVEWDNGRTTVLLTSLPKTTVDASEIVFSYFRRWPCQELPYRYAKATACLSRIAGYGRKRVENTRQREKQEKLARMIDTLTEQLKDAIEERNVHERAIARLIPKERRLRAKTMLVNGKRIVPRSIGEDFERCGKEIRRHEAAIRAIERRHEEEFKKLRRSRREWLRLQGKDTDYAVDVELDQILTYFRASLINLYAYFIRYFLGCESLSLAGLVHRVLYLPAEIEVTDTARKVLLQSNPQDPRMMARLQNAVAKLNGLNIKGENGGVLEFSLGC